MSGREPPKRTPPPMSEDIESKYSAEELTHVEIWFTKRAKVVSLSDRKFCVSMSPGLARDYLETLLNPLPKPIGVSAEIRIVATGIPTVRVRITKASRDSYWYAGLQGQEFDCYRYRRGEFVLKEDYDSGDAAPWRHIGMEDCEIVGEGES